MQTPNFIRPFLIALAFAILNGGIAAQAKKPRIKRKQITQAVTVSASNPTPEQGGTKHLWPPGVDTLNRQLEAGAFEKVEECYDKAK